MGTNDHRGGSCSETGCRGRTGAVTRDRPAPGDPDENRTELTERVQADQVSLLRFAYGDLAGITRCKAIHVSQLPDKLVSGVGLTPSRNKYCAHSTAPSGRRRGSPATWLFSSDRTRREQTSTRTQDQESVPLSGTLTALTRADGRAFPV
jgi:hypothetical protein